MTESTFIIEPALWKVEKIGVIGPGIVGMPMAALLAHSKVKIGSGKPARVIIVQRNSKNSGWKVAAINEGRSVIGGIEPGLDEMTASSVNDRLLSATHDISELSDADVILVSVQTDKKGLEPDYGPLFGALESLGVALQNKPAGKMPLVIFESTLAPTTMDTLIRGHFQKYGLQEGKDILLGNSPNRVMPGRLVERVRESDKLAGGLTRGTAELIEKLYMNVVSKGKIYKTNSLTAEIVKTLENAYRDVRIAFSAEIARYCDGNDISFYNVRDNVNTKLAQKDTASSDPNAVPSGGILIPMLGVGGHCLPKDGILLWWRNIQSEHDTSNSLILQSRSINDESPIMTFQQAERFFGDLSGSTIALLGTAYRFNSEDTRNSPTLLLANYLRERGINYIMHDPYVKEDDQNLLNFEQTDHYTRDLDEALQNVDYIFMCTGHKEYIDKKNKIMTATGLKGVMDACNIYSHLYFELQNIPYTGIGRGKNIPEREFVDFVHDSFRVMEKGLALELSGLIEYYNSNFVHDDFNAVKYDHVQKLASTCSTGCEIADPEVVEHVPEYNGFISKLALNAKDQSREKYG